MTSTAPRIKTQNERVLDYLRNVGPLTQEQAKDLFGVARLGARVYDLKQRGFEIASEPVKVPTRYGTPATVARYSLIAEHEPA